MIKNFNWNKFTKRIAIKSDMTSVYNAWTISAELEKWFLSKASFYNEKNKPLPASSNAVAGSGYKWQWFSQEAPETGETLEANGKDFFQFTFAGECKVDIRLSELKDHVIVELTQKEIPEDDRSKVKIRLECAFGWAFYLVNLKSVLEGGIDLRNKNKDIIQVVNN